jgi:CHAT domain-containing protein
MSFLPLHAAGKYSSQSSHAASKAQLVISSYIPSLSVLLPRKRVINHSSKAVPKVLAVSQPSTPGHSSLPGTHQEIRRVRNLINDITWLDDHQATVPVVLNAMAQHNIVHFACHGIQDSSNPLNSGFILHDGRLTLQTLMAAAVPAGELAVLSACQTAAGDRALTQEAMHLAAGMLSVGYRNVIGTMWSIDDRDAPIIAAKLYSELLKPRNSNTEWRDDVAEALHLAVQQLKAEVGEEAFIRWVPFIHFASGESEE